MIEIIYSVKWQGFILPHNFPFESFLSSQSIFMTVLMLISLFTSYHSAYSARFTQKVVYFMNFSNNIYIFKKHKITRTSFFCFLPQKKTTSVVAVDFGELSRLKVSDLHWILVNTRTRQSGNIWLTDSAFNLDRNWIVKSFFATWKYNIELEDES